MLLGSEATREVSAKTVHNIMKNPTELLYWAISSLYALTIPNAGVKREPKPA